MKKETLQLGPYTYTRKWQNSIIMKIIKRLTSHIVNLYDAYWDFKVCHCSLVKYVPSLYRETMGATGSQSARYWALDDVFKDFECSSDDKFIDVGCGKGRILAYLLREKMPCKLTGIELNKDVAAFASSWSKDYKQVNIINGNAFELDYNDYNILFLARPFETEFFKKFLEKIENELTHSVRFFYYYDTQSGYMLKDRAGWTKIRRKWFWKKYGLYFCECPQRWTEWIYEPTKKIKA